MWVIRIANPYDPYGLMIRMGFFWKNVIFICNIASNNNIKLISTTCNTHKGRRRSSNRVKRHREEEEEEEPQRYKKWRKKKERARLWFINLFDFVSDL